MIFLQFIRVELGNESYHVLVLVRLLVHVDCQVRLIHGQVQFFSLFEFLLLFKFLPLSHV